MKSKIKELFERLQQLKTQVKEDNEEYVNEEHNLGKRAKEFSRVMPLLMDRIPDLRMWLDAVGKRDRNGGASEILYLKDYIIHYSNEIYAIGCHCSISPENWNYRSENLIVVYKPEYLSDAHPIFHMYKEKKRDIFFLTLLETKGEPTYEYDEQRELFICDFEEISSEMTEEMSRMIKYEIKKEEMRAITHKNKGFERE